MSGQGNAAVNVNAKICLVEDDPTIRQLVAEKLKAADFAVDAHERADGLMSDPALFKFDLYILDIMLPGESSGLELCEKIRAHSPTVPILILSALGEPSDKIEGLRRGADDYLAKPFEMEELLLRVNGMLKRRSWYRAFPKDSSVFTWGENEIDFQNLEGKRGYEKFKMSQKECMLMKLLIEREDQVVTREDILDRVWGYNIFPSTRTVDNFILRLRKYFEREPASPRYIHSVRGIGYKFTSKGNE